MMTTRQNANLKQNQTGRLLSANLRPGQSVRARMQTLSVGYQGGSELENAGSLNRLRT